MPPHRAQAPALHSRKGVSHFPLGLQGFQGRKPQHSHRALDEERGGVSIRSRVETITPQPTPPQRTGSSAQFPLAHLGNHVGGATQLCVGTEIAPSRSARTVLGQQANFASKARAWCSLQAGGELLAAPRNPYEQGGGIAPALASKLLAAKRSQPPPATIFAASSPFLTFQAPCKVLICTYIMMYMMRNSLKWLATPQEMTFKRLPDITGPVHLSLE
jgi:hypothetical protein